MIRITFLMQKPTDIVIRDGKTYVSIKPIGHELWGSIYEEIEVLRGKDYDPARGTYGSRSGRYSRAGGHDPYGFSRRRRYFDESGDNTVKPDPVTEQFLACVKASTITREEFYHNVGITPDDL